MEELQVTGGERRMRCVAPAVVRKCGCDGKKIQQRRKLG